MQLPLDPRDITDYALIQVIDGLICSDLERHALIWVKQLHVLLHMQLIQRVDTQQPDEQQKTFDMEMFS